MQALAKRQQGLTFISLIFVLGFIGFVVLLFLKIAPVYLDHSKVSNCLSELKKTPHIQSQSQSEIKENLRRQFSINDISEVSPDNITVTKYGNYLRVAIDYEVVRKIIGNLSVLMQFNDVIEVGDQ